MGPDDAHEEGMDDVLAGLDDGLADGGSPVPRERNGVGDVLGIVAPALDLGQQKVIRPLPLVVDIF